MDLTKHKRTLVLLFILGVSWVLSFYLSTQLLMRENQEIVVPRVVGFPIAEATRIMQQRKINVKIEKIEEPSDFPENAIISQSVEPGTIIKEDRTIILRISKPMETMQIPNLVGKELMAAKKMLEKSNLRLKNVVSACSKKVKAGIVIGQSPRSEEVSVGHNIQLLMSSGPCQNQFVISNLLDRRIEPSTKREFSDKEVQLKLWSESQTRENLSRARVSKQEPPAGSIVKSGENVVLTMD